MSNTSLTCLVPGFPCTEGDLQAIAEELIAAIKAGKDNRLVLTMASYNAFGLISLSGPVPIVGPLNAALKGVRKAKTLEEATEWAQRCYDAGIPQVVPLPVWAWQAQMLHLVTQFGLMLRAKDKADNVVADAIQKAQKPTTH